MKQPLLYTKRQSGFTLIELMVSMIIGLLILAALIALMLNVTESDHRDFEQSIRAMVSSLEGGKEAAAAFPDAHERTRTLARTIFKREWNRIKDQINAA